MKLLSLSRAARLVGQSRGTLQKQVQDGTLTSFEGKISLQELVNLYPQAEVEDNAMLEKIEEIIERARFKARNPGTPPPDRETLTARVTVLSNELAHTKQELGNHIIFMDKLKSRLKTLARDTGAEGKAILQQLSDWLAKEAVAHSELDQAQIDLLARDTVLRIMAAQVHLEPSGHEFLVEGNTTLLESGLSAGFALNYGCSNGNCGMCKARLIEGEVKKVRQHDYALSESEKASNMFLMCSHTALTDLVLEAEEAGVSSDIPRQTISAWVRKLEPISEQIQLLNIRTPRTKRLRFLAGQSVELRTEKGHQAVLPVASCPCDEINLQFHIDTTQDGAFYQELAAGVKVGTGITLQGPEGDFVLREEPPHPFLFLAMDTGFAPIKSLIEHALTLDIAESLHLYRFSSEAGAPYLDNMCRAWDDAFDNFHYEYQHCEVLDALPAVFDTLSQQHPELARYQAYIAGPDEFIRHSENYCLQQGIPAELIRQKTV